ncbi:MAG: alpha/beta hydrolase, partial [Gammaproteobacteria bacterium]|nr:alpha/beta hydrolase [Gammaproteobacteria bacterium]
EQPSVYLARPCQYVMPATGCSMKYWTSHRYAEEVVVATSEAISQIKKRHGVQKLELFGYSGGAAIAALVAARRDDVTRLITVAGNMDHEYWTAYHNVSPLSGSLNAADYAGQLQMIHQIHLVGDEDVNVPLEVINAYLNRIDRTGKVSVHEIPDYDHECCWAENWNRLLKIYVN